MDKGIHIHILISDLKEGTYLVCVGFIVSITKRSITHFSIFHLKKCEREHNNYKTQGNDKLCIAYN